MEEVRLIKPYIDFEAVAKDFQQVFDSGVFTRGPNVSAFSAELASYVGAKYAFPTTSATTALWVSLKAVGVGKGDEVAVSDFSFPATANVVEDLGAKPLFVDVDPLSFNMCGTDLLEKITPKTKAVIFVDSFGNPTNLDGIKNICDELSIPLIEDAACALGSGVENLRCGNISKMTCFSFHPRKLICTGEGGAITTNDDDLAKWLEIKLLHGASKSQEGILEFSDYGFNFRLSELQAVMGRKQLMSLDEIIKGRNKTRDFYEKILSPYGFQAQMVSPSAFHNSQSVVFTVPGHIDRDDLIAKLKMQSIETTIGTYCQSNLPYFRNKYCAIQPNSKRLQETTITLPCYETVPTERICQEILSLTRS